MRSRCPLPHSSQRPRLPPTRQLPHSYLRPILGETRVPATAWDAVFGLFDAQLSHARFPHNDRVNHAAFSSDGKQVLTASIDRTARLWPAGPAVCREWVQPVAMPCLNSVERKRVLLERQPRVSTPMLPREHGLPEEAAPE